ncbi:MAG TPA: GH92 family glycosyl hydrolase [Labilithrix sp.]|nr:GH92 family glycosyl hydrolase [Labilithrix sp.]
MRRRRSLLALLAVAATALSCSSSDGGGGAPPPGADGPVRVDDDDVFCDPVDAIADDVTPATPSAAPLTQWVDPRIGTGGLGFAVGTTYPGPQLPFGMAKPGPDTSKNGKSESFAHCSGYAYDDDTIEGFSLARLHGAGIADYGGIALMPTLGMSPAKARPRAHGSRFSHDTESAKPGYYAVTLADTGVRVELTATARVGIMRFAFPAGADEVVLVDVGHVLAEGNTIRDGEIAIDPAAREVRGFAHVDGSYSSRASGAKLYFVARFDRAFAAHGTYVGGLPTDAALAAKGKDAGAFLHFDGAAATVEAQVGLSFTDVAHARANLDAERKPFEEARAAAEAIWERRLAALQVDARSDRDRRILYTALYHTALMPTLASDVDGGYRGIDDALHAAQGFRYFTDFSLWDTYRTLHPLVTLLYPDDARELAASLTAMAKDAGFVPRWPIATGESGGMVGDGGTLVLADPWVKGVRDWDAAGAYAVARAQAMTPPAPGKGGRDRLQDYVTIGYIPTESGNNSAGTTLEYASADHALGELATALGETTDAATFHARGKSWEKIYDDRSHLFVGHRRDGTFDEPNPAAMSSDFSEGTPWHYNFMVPHDIDALAARMGKPMLLARAEQLFTRAACGTPTPAFLPSPYYWASNEPVLFSGWVFSALGDQERTARWTRWTTLTHYGDGPDGLPGNDDGGTMSAFYVFAALGLYPIAGTDRYVLGSPLFPRATLALRGGPLTIDAPAASKQHRFPRAVTRNGAPSPTVVHHADLAGATLHYDLETTPLTARLP